VADHNTISLPTPTTPIDLPTPLPTPTITAAKPLECVEDNVASSTPVSAETAANTFQMSPLGSLLGIMADISGMVAKTSLPAATNQTNPETSSDVLSVTNPLYISSAYLTLYSLCSDRHDAFGMPENSSFQDITVDQGTLQNKDLIAFSSYLTIGPSVSKGKGKGKKKAAAGEEKDRPIYPTKSMSTRYI
jgi:hypothetical protein